MGAERSSSGALCCGGSGCFLLAFSGGARFLVIRRSHGRYPPSTTLAPESTSAPRHGDRAST
jgi:hypothetical protein